MCTRRRLIWLIPTGAVALAAGPCAAAKKTAAPPAAKTRLDERDPHAQAVGYVEEATRVDRRAWPKYRPGSLCLNCALYRDAAQPWSECSLFPGKLVAARGWCDAYVTRAPG